MKTDFQENLSFLVGINKENGKTVVKVSKKFFRPAEVDVLLGDSTKARTELGWKPTYDWKSLAKEMVVEDMKLAKTEKMLLNYSKVSKR